MNNNIPMNWTILTSYKAMHETKSPHVNHIHQHKSHNTIDLDLQSLYSISIRKYYNDSMQQAILSKLQANIKWERALIFIQPRVKIPRRKAHGISKEGAPCGKSGAAKCGLRAATSPTLNTCQIKVKGRGGCATSWECGLPPQWCATSPRGAHLLIHMCQDLLKSKLNHLPIKLILSHLTISLTLPLFYLQYFPHISFLFLPWLIFIELKWPFWVFESKINFEWWKSLILLK